MLTVVIPFGVAIPARLMGALSPAFWPNVVSAVLLGLGALVTLAGVVRLKGHEPIVLREVDAAETDLVETDTSETSLRPATRFAMTTSGIVSLFAYCWLIEPIGMVAASALAIVVFAKLYGEQHLATVLMIAATLPLTLHLFFLYAVGVPIPLGIFDRFIYG